MRNPNRKANKRPSPSLVTGIIAFVFLVIGYEAALFIGRAGTLRLLANRDAPDTVYLIDSEAVQHFLSSLPAEELPGLSGEERLGQPGNDGTRSGEDAPDPGRYVSFRRNAPHEAAAERVVERQQGRRVESFRFDPNTVSVEDLIRLGFSRKQAESIAHYREKGGRFRRKGDFARSYVVADSVYERLEPYIDIPLLDLNAADSAALTSLPGIGPWYAGKIVEHRKALRGYSYKEQLLDIWRFDREKYDGLSDLITVSPPAPYPLWTLPEDSLALHPYIGKYAAHGVVLYRKNSPRETWTVENLVNAGIFDTDNGKKLSRCRIAAPD